MPTSQYDSPPFGEDWSQDGWETPDPLPVKTEQFDSKAELISVEPIHGLALQYGWNVKIQVPFTEQNEAQNDFRDWVLAKWGQDLPTWTNHDPTPCWHDNCKYCWNTPSTVYVIYRADFVLEKEQHKIIVEIDGKNFHKDKEKEHLRDAYFYSKGFLVIHIDSNQAFQGNFTELEKTLQLYD